MGLGFNLPAKGRGSVRWGYGRRAEGEIGSGLGFISRVASKAGLVLGLTGGEEWCGLRRQRRVGVMWGGPGDNGRRRRRVVIVVAQGRRDGTRVGG